MGREYYFVETLFDGNPLIILKGYHTREEAEQALAQEVHGGRIISYPSRDKRFVYSAWKQQQRQGYPSPY